jgi:glutathione S-transferase
MKAAPALELMGVPGSPYTRKMLALMRYRRIPYRLLPGTRHLLNDNKQRFRPRPKPRVPLLPTFYSKNEQGLEEAVTDTSPLIRRFEKDYEGRSVIPDDPVLALIDFIIEDYADEWFTKAMFHYRWSFAQDIEKAGQMLSRWSNLTATDEQIAERSRQICDLQISRLSYVGSNEITRPTIESSFKRFIKLLDKLISKQHFVLGHRPSSSDFAIYGQLVCLALFDPTPQAIIVETAPRVYAWTEVMEDLSGYELLEDDWLTSDTLPDELRDILAEIGRLYAPYLLANAAAVVEGQTHFEMVLDNKPWRQNTFTYQAKCLTWIRQEYSSLSADDKSRADDIFGGTGIEQLFD